MNLPARRGVSVGITNTRLSAAKRGIAVELATRLAVAAGTHVCVVGADPADRDAERSTERLVAEGESEAGSGARLERGPHFLDVRFLPARRLCVVSVSDRAGLQDVFATLQERFSYVVVDAPSRAGTGIGISSVLLQYLDLLLVASGLTASDLAETRAYLERLERIPVARHTPVRVLSSGDPGQSGLAPAQLARRLRGLPTIATIPQLWGRVAHDCADRDLDAAFAPVVGWIVACARARAAGVPPDPCAAARAGSLGRHVAARHYREHAGQ